MIAEEDAANLAADLERYRPALESVQISCSSGAASLAQLVPSLLHQGTPVWLG